MVSSWGRRCHHSPSESEPRAPISERHFGRPSLADFGTLAGDPPDRPPTGTPGVYHPPRLGAPIAVVAEVVERLPRPAGICQIRPELVKDCQNRPNAPKIGRNRVAEIARNRARHWSNSRDDWPKSPTIGELAQLVIWARRRILSRREARVVEALRHSRFL